MRARLFLIACLAAAAQPAAAQPARDVTPLHYQLTVTPDLAKATFDGDLWIDLQVAVPSTRITLDAVDLEIRDALIRLPYDRQVKPTIQADAAAGTVTFTTPSRLYPGAIKLHVEYAGKLRSDGRGFYVVESHGRKYLLSQMESTDARRAFPCADTPAIKTSFALAAVIDGGLTAISNGARLSDTADPATGRRTVRFSTTPKMSSYLVALAVGQFTCLEGSAGSIPVRVCTTPERRGTAPFALEAAQRALQADGKYFTSRYPFRKLDLVAVPGGFPGAMENSGAIFFDEGLLVDPASAPESAVSEMAGILSHEIAHQWLGNLVTMKWWDDLWLNEGLATWLAPKALEEWKREWRLEISRAASASEAMRLDSLRSSRPVRAQVTTEAEIEESFDEIAYQKAAAVASMIEAWIGEHAFRDGLNSYVREHAYGSATGEDLWNRLAASSGLPVDQVMRAFLTRPGVPLVSVDTRCDAGETIVDVTVRRFTLDGTAEAEAAWPVPLLVRGVSPTAPMFTPVARLVTQPRDSFRVLGCFQAVLVNSGAAGYFYSAYSPAALAYLATMAQARLTPAERVRLLDDEWALAAAGAHGIGEYLSLAQAIADDPTPQVIEAASRGLASLGSDLVDERARKPFDAWIARVFGPLTKQLGWQAAPDDTPDRRRLRAAVLEIVGGAGRDPAILAAARTLAAEGRVAEKTDPALEPTITRLAARTADAALLERLRAREAAVTLGSAADAAFVTRALAESLKSTDPAAGFPNALAAALRNPAVRGEVWSFLKSRWSEIQPRLDGAFAFSAVVSATGSFCDGDARDDVRKFFAGKTPVARTLDLALERIDACRDMRLRQQGALTAWLAKQ